MGDTSDAVEQNAGASMCESHQALAYSPQRFPVTLARFLQVRLRPLCDIQPLATSLQQFNVDGAITCAVSRSQTSCYATAAANRCDVGLKLQLLAKVHNLGGCRRTVPPEHKGDRMESRTHAEPGAGHTETKNVCYTRERERITDHNMFKFIH